MKTADLITSYLNNEMSPEQERQFLLSVAASDSLRLSLKSHVMLDKIVTNQIQHAHVPENVRNVIFSQMHASVSGGGSVGAAASAAGADATEGASLLGRFLNGAAGRFGRGALVALLTVGGFAAGYLTHSELAPVSPSVVAAAPATGVPSGVPGTVPQTGSRASAPVAPVTAEAPMSTSTAAATHGNEGARNGAIADAARPAQARIVPATRIVRDRESSSRSQTPAIRKQTVPPATPATKPADDPGKPTPPAGAEAGGTDEGGMGRSASGPKQVSVLPTIEQIPPAKTEDSNNGGPRE
jgi:hypothetical protein